MLRRYWGQCLVGIALVAVVAFLIGVRPVTILAFGAALACPLMMVLMMGGIGRVAHRHLTGHEAGPAQEPRAPQRDDARESLG